ncbi:uncharacterized protein VTP21DRAFT_2853 [Calcarisporiella thermophila]|uniref:uncharacterized protein n=1 Tax=Calcarisporiella thermophila TaxID=911321 RepID=UPI003742EC3A
MKLPLLVSLSLLFVTLPTVTHASEWRTARASVGLHFSSSLEKRGKSEGHGRKAPSNTHRTTWYSGQDLRNAACYGRKGLAAYNAQDSSMIAAFKGGLNLCYKCIEVAGGKGTNGGKMVVKLVDQCAGCYRDNDIDLTKAAFKKLAPLDRGEVEVSWRPLTKCPREGKWPTSEGRRK